MVIKNENMEKAKRLSSILAKKLGNDYIVFKRDIDRIETIFAYIRADKKKREDNMRQLIKRSVNKAREKGIHNIDPFELFIDAGIYKNTVTLQDFISS